MKIVSNPNFYPVSAPMRYQNVCLESFGYTLPEEIVSSEQLESRLLPLYERLRLPQGRLELMTGIRERRFWAPDTLPSEKSIESGRRAIEAAGIDRNEIGALIHGSVCRDHLEPATAAAVHHGLELPQECQIYDVSNACLGLMNGMLQVANMIELGHIRAGLVVGTEGSRQLVGTTIDWLNREQTLTRNAIKTAVASLTIGSASCAMLICHRELSRGGSSLLGAAVRANTAHHRLCQSGADEAMAGGMTPLMNTDSERLMHEGVATGLATFTQFLRTMNWTPADIDKSAAHQVGGAHRKMLAETLGFKLENDYTTFEWLGNTGAAALPITVARAVEEGFIVPGDNVSMMGIGSGINSVIVGLKWGETRVLGGVSA